MTHGRHAKPATHHAIPAIILAILAFTLPVFLGHGADAAVAWGPADSPANKALNWAEMNALGHWYAWGGTGPDYDCSGLVMEAYGHADGIWLPHNTNLMIASGKLARTWSPQRGDLAFWGSPGNYFHVEFVTVWAGTTFGAHHSGTRVGWVYDGSWFRPSAYYHVR